MHGIFCHSAGAVVQENADSSEDAHSRLGEAGGVWRLRNRFLFDARPAAATVGARESAGDARGFSRAVWTYGSAGFPGAPSARDGDREASISSEGDSGQRVRASRRPACRERFSPASRSSFAADRPDERGMACRRAICLSHSGIHRRASLSSTPRAASRAHHSHDGAPR